MCHLFGNCEKNLREKKHISRYAQPTNAANAPKGLQYVLRNSNQLNLGDPQDNPSLPKYPRSGVNTNTLLNPPSVSTERMAS